MTKRKQSIPDSYRWPQAFNNLEASSLLVDSQGWKLVEADLQNLLDSLVYDVVHETKTMELTNFYRGQIAVLERVLGLRQELEGWKQEHK